MRWGNVAVSLNPASWKKVPHIHIVCVCGGRDATLLVAVWGSQFPGIKCWAGRAKRSLVRAIDGWGRRKEDPSFHHMVNGWKQIMPICGTRWLTRWPCKLLAMISHAKGSSSGGKRPAWIHGCAPPWMRSVFDKTGLNNSLLLLRWNYGGDTRVKISLHSWKTIAGRRYLGFDRGGAACLSRPPKCDWGNSSKEKQIYIESFIWHLLGRRERAHSQWLGIGRLFYFLRQNRMSTKPIGGMRIKVLA